VVIEVEPEDDGWGGGFSPAIQAAWPTLRAATDRAARGDVEQVVRA
jgi:hypothetical protein